MVNKTIFKIATLFLLSGLFNFSYGQACSGVFFSEYIDGGGTSNRALEIYNASYASVDLSTYRIEMFGNGNVTPSVTINLSSSLAPNNVYVVANPSASAAILSQADQTDANIAYNGNDAILLMNGTDTVDIFGVIGQNPGVSWTGGGLSTATQVLTRKYIINDGVKNNPTSFDPSAQWDGFVSTDFTHIGDHDNTCHCTTVYSGTTDSICNGDSILFGGVYLDSTGNYSDTVPSMVTGCDSVITLTLQVFPNSPDSIRTVTICNTDSILFEGVYYKTPGTYSTTYTNQYGCDSTFQLNLFMTSCSGCSDLFFSEYIDGGATSNRALEIYNPTASAINLSGYSIELYGNGNLSPSVVINLTGSVAPYDVYVIANPSADAAILAQADMTDAGIQYNGNDAVALFSPSGMSDLIGVIGQNPGVSWSGSGVSTANQVITRKPNATIGVTNNPGSFDPSINWFGFPSNDFSHIGVHASNCQSCSVDTATINNSICSNDSLLFGGTYLKTAGTYIDSATNAGGCDSITTLNLTVNNCALDTGDCNELFISEYIQSNGVDHLLEIYNPTSDSVDLSVYEFKIFQDGNSSPTVVLPLSGFIQSQDVYNVVDVNSLPVYVNKADILYNDLGYNGNDAVVLFKGTDTVDIFGKIGQNPGVTGWMGNTQDVVLVRKTAIKIGVRNNPTSFDPSIEWNIEAADDTTFLNDHESSCDTCQNIYTRDTATICDGDSIFFAGSYRKDSGFYLGFVTLANGCDSFVGFTLYIDTNEYVVTINDSICSGDSILFAGNYYSVAGTYSDTSSTTISGCDSVTTLVLTNKTVCDTTSCKELFFSEYMEGGGAPSRALEIFNPTNLPVNLSNYSVEVYGNGSTSAGVTLNLAGTLAPYDVYVIANPSADAFVISQSDTTSFVAQFNGNDVLVLKKGANQIDIIGIVGDNPGISWSGGGVSTANQVMVRKTTVKEGITINPASFDPSTEWIGYPNNDFSYIGYHISDCKCTSDSLITYDSICNGDSVLFAGNYYYASGTYYDTNINSTGCDSIQTLVLSNKSNCTIDSVNCNELIISEYIEGTGLNKVIELYNPKNDTVDIDLYSIHAFTNGSPTATHIYPLTGVVAAKDVYVITNFSADPAYVNASDKQFGALAINGNDAFALLKGTDTVDIFGVIGQDPGAAGWMSLTTDNSLTRIPSISKGVVNNPSTFNPGIQWISNGINDTTNVGFHLSNCDSCITQTQSINQVICQGDSVLFGGAYYSSTGNYNDTVQLSSGCDSIITLLLSVQVPFNSTISDSICSGDSLLFGGVYRTNAGSYVDSNTSSIGCDSIVTLQLSIANGFNIAISNSVCNGDSVLFAGVYYSTPGTYSDTVTLSGGCDSITTLTLSSGSASNSSFTDSICPGGSVVYGGVTYTAAGNYIDTIQTAAGCDSVITLTINAKSYNTTTINDNICPGDSVLFAGTYYKNPGTYTDTVSSVNSCDTILTLNLTANANVVPTIAISTSNNNVCSNQAAVFTSTITNGGSSPVYQWSINGANAATGSTFNSLPGQLNSGDTIKCFMISSLSCAQPDTAYSNEVVMIVNGGSTDTIIDTICEGTDYYFGSDTITTSGVYYDTVANGSGCDSITMLMLQVNTAPIVIADNDKDTVGVNGTVSFIPAASNASIYTWDFGDGFSANLTSATHTFATPGTYQVVLTGEGVNGCISYDTVTIVVINDVSLTEFSNNKFVKIYPNPVSNELTVSTAGSEATFNHVRLFDAKGTLVKQLKLSETNQMIIDMSLFEKGFYYLSVTGNRLNKNIKLTKF